MGDSLTEGEVRRQLAAMGAARFDLGALSPHDRMMLSEDCGASLILSAIKSLLQESIHGAHIFIRPHGQHALSVQRQLFLPDALTHGFCYRRDGGCLT